MSRVVLVTGASSGIGEAICEHLLGEGWTVYAAARRVERMAGLEDRGAKVLALDVTDAASIDAAVQAIHDAEGHLDALVNNAGYGSYGALEDVPIDEARRQFEVNVFGLMALSRRVLPAMRDRGRGTIVNISSMGGRIWMPMGGWYHATKHAVEVLSDVLRVEVAPFGVAVVVIQPGAIRSEWSGIAAQSLRERSGDTPYAGPADNLAKRLESPDYGAPAHVVATAVTRALGPRPRRRYTVPSDARMMVFLRWLLPDWAFERLITAVI